MAKYRKIPVIIEAVQFKSYKESRKDIEKLASKSKCSINFICTKREVRVGAVGSNKIHDRFTENVYKVIINTLSGKVMLSIGDYIVLGVNNELYPCKKDIFKKTYEKVEEKS